MQWWQVYVLAWAGTAALSAMLTWLCCRWAPALGFMDQPSSEGHKRHAVAIPVLGGVAMVLAWTAVIGGGLLVSRAFQGLLSPRLSLHVPGIQTVAPQLAVIIAGALAISGVGVVDDRWPLGPLPKLVAQFCVAGAVACWGVRVTLFWSHPFATWLITLLWILVVINALNFFDNMDGLAAGTAAIAAFFFAFVAGIRGQHFVALLGTMTCGAACGFLVFNRSPARIFMGDSGSHFLGYALAVTGALTTFYTPTESPTPAPILIPVLVLALPLFDALAVVLIRLHTGRPIYVGDQMHISHRFTHLGLSRAQAVVVIWLLAFAAGAGAVTLLWLPAAGTLIVLLQVAAILAVVTLIQFLASNRNQPPCSIQP